MSPKQKRCQPLLSFRRGTGILDPLLEPTPAAACASERQPQVGEVRETLRAHSTGIVSFVSGRSDAVDLRRLFSASSSAKKTSPSCLLSFRIRRTNASTVCGSSRSSRRWRRRVRRLGLMLLLGRRRRVGPLCLVFVYCFGSRRWRAARAALLWCSFCSRCSLVSLKFAARCNVRIFSNELCLLALAQRLLALRAARSSSTS